jgi:hypothetical protein
MPEGAIGNHKISGREFLYALLLCLVRIIASQFQIMFCKPISLMEEFLLKLHIQKQNIGILVAVPTIKTQLVSISQIFREYVMSKMGTIYTISSI